MYNTKIFVYSLYQNTNAMIYGHDHDYHKRTIVPDDFYDNCLMEADGKGTFLFFDDDLTVPMKGRIKDGFSPHFDKWDFEAHTSFYIDEDLDVDLDRLILRGFELSKDNGDDEEDPYFPKYNWT